MVGDVRGQDPAGTESDDRHETTTTTRRIGMNKATQQGWSKGGHEYRNGSIRIALGFSTFYEEDWTPTSWKTCEIHIVRESGFHDGMSMSLNELKQLVPVLTETIERLEMT
jgi:hypothetical protein